MYKKRTKGSRKLKNMREAKCRKIAAGPAPAYPPELPELRRTIIVIDYDFGPVAHRIDLYKTRRIDCYRAVVDGKPWRDKIGWSRVLEVVRKGFIRLSSPYHL